MRPTTLIICSVVVVLIGALFYFFAAEAKWSGVDEAVVKKFAEEAGRPPREPYINTGEGDLLLFCFLSAGTLGGFIAGYYFRDLFPPKTTELRTQRDV